MKKIKKNEFKVEIEGNTIIVWNRDQTDVGSASTDDLAIEDLTEAQIEKLTLLAKKDLNSRIKEFFVLTPKMVSAESLAYKFANPRK